MRIIRTRRSRGVYMLTEEGRELKNAYLREWAKKNRERKQASDDAYWNRKAERLHDNGTSEDRKE